MWHALTQHSVRRPHDSTCLKHLQETMQVNMQMVCLHLVFCFCPGAFSFFISCLCVPISTPSLPLSLPPLWFCRSSHDQARYPGNYLALSNNATTDSNEEWNIKDQHCLCSHYLSTQETERRSESSGTCREATTTLSLPFLDKYHQWEQQSQTCPGSEVTAYLFVLHTCPLLARGAFHSGRSAALTVSSQTFLVCVLLSRSERSKVGNSWMWSRSKAVTSVMQRLISSVGAFIPHKSNTNGGIRRSWLPRLELNSWQSISLKYST